MPDSPGVYIMKDARGRVIYVGKAKSLPKRVVTYFQQGPASVKTTRLVRHVVDLEYMVTGTEKEALILENSLIKKHRPKYNIILRDDKTYPSLRLTTREKWPRLEVVRRVEKDGSVYFGPFSSATAMRKTLAAMRRLFPLRQCKRPEPSAVKRPCLNYHMGRCLGPCRGKVSPDEYRALVDDVVLFFKGRNKELTQSLRTKMQEASANMDYEAAARYRDRLRDIERTLEKQTVAWADQGDIDVFGLAVDRGQTTASVMFIRNGSVLGSRNMHLGARLETAAEVAEHLVLQYYGDDNYIPDEVLTPTPIENSETIAEWLREKKGKAVRLAAPVRGRKKSLLDLASKNAALALADRLRQADLGADALLELQQKLGLPEPPARIEGYDMSNLHGESSVGAMVVLENGQWIKSDYRRFKIKEASGQDDYAMMSEVLGRRLSKDDLPRPDLIMLDGGRGQLGVALAVVEDLHLEDAPPMIGLAKGREGEADKVFLPGRKNPVSLSADSPGLLLLMRVRDESHRYVQDYHHRLRARESARSVLDDIPGIGPAKRKTLLEHFGSLAAIKSASIDDLAAAPGLSQTNARAVHEFFHKE